MWHFDPAIKTRGGSMFRSLRTKTFFSWSHTNPINNFETYGWKWFIGLVWDHEKNVFVQRERNIDPSRVLKWSETITTNPEARFSTLMNGPDKLEHLSPTSLSSLVKCNTLTYLAYSYEIKWNVLDIPLCYKFVSSQRGKLEGLLPLNPYVIFVDKARDLPLEWVPWWAFPAILGLGEVD
jgi:hypothetical protein